MLITLLKQALKEGHTSLTDLEIMEYFKRRNREDIYDINQKEFINKIKEYENFIQEKVEIDKVKVNGDEIWVYTLKEVKRFEKRIGEIIEYLNSLPQPEADVTEDEIKEDLKENAFVNLIQEEYEEILKEQINAVKSLLRKRVGILTGPAGSGKTHVIKALVKAMLKNGLKEIKVLTPTGKAAMRTMEKLKGILEVKTIHRFISTELRNFYDFEYFILKEVPEESRKKKLDAIIIDEASMVDTQTLGMLLTLINKNNLQYFIMIGDVNQLPPVDAGKPFYDLYQYLQKNHKDCIVKLEKILRTECKKIVEFSKIFLTDTPYAIKEQILNELFSNKISEDNADKFSIRTDEKEVITVKVVKNNIRKEVEKAIEELLRENDFSVDAKGFYKFLVYEDKLQILTPTRIKGENGSYNLSLFLRQESRFAKKADIVLQKQFYMGDKVIQTKNDYKIEVFNGMMGYVLRNGKVKFFFPPKKFAYLNQLGENLDYAYAITIHKSQGSEFENVLLVIPKGLKHFKSREMMYTAVTRAQRRLYIIVEDHIANLLNVSASELLKRKTYLFDNPIDVRLLPENLRIITLNGEKVRSWQECLIANLLRKAEIEYQYEPLSAYLDIGVCPDFKLISKDKEILWEHYGMEDEKYLRHQKEKEEKYKKAGFVIRKLSEIDESTRLERKVLIISTYDDLKDNRKFYQRLNILKNKM